MQPMAGDKMGEVPLGLEGFGDWTQSSVHYSWRSERTGSWRDCRLPWRIIECDGRRWLDDPEGFFNVVLRAGDDDWRDYVFELDVSVSGGPGGPSSCRTSMTTAR